MPLSLETQEALRALKDSVEALQVVQDRIIYAINLLNQPLTAQTAKPATVPAAQQPATVPAAAPRPTTQPAKAGQFASTSHICEAFNPLLSEKLDFTSESTEWVIKGKDFLQPNDYREVLGTVQTLGGKYVSAGKNSHFIVPKRGN